MIVTIHGIFSYTCSHANFSGATLIIKTSDEIKNLKTIKVKEFYINCDECDHRYKKKFEIDSISVSLIVDNPTNDNDDDSLLDLEDAMENTLDLDADLKRMLVENLMIDNHQYIKINQ